MSDFKVTIEYKNKDLETVVEKEYDFIDYTEKLNIELKRILKDIEEAFCYLSGKPQNEWNSETVEKFSKIRHKILDEANAVRRLPENLSFRNIKANSMSFGEYLARTNK